MYIILVYIILMYIILMYIIFMFIILMYIIWMFIVQAVFCLSRPGVSFGWPSWTYTAGMEYITYALRCGKIALYII